jgi:hypothetical protein
MRHTPARLLAALLFTTALACAQTVATTVYDGLNKGSAGVRDFYDTDDVAGVRLLTNNSSYTLGNISLMLVWNAAPFNAWPTGTPTASVYATSNPLGSSAQRTPDSATLLGTYSFASVLQPRGTVSATRELVSLTPNAPITLAASTEYWVVFSMASGNGMSILGVTSVGDTATGLFNENVLGSSSFGAATNFNVASGGYSFALEATPVTAAVPEPSTYALLACGVALLLVRRRVFSRAASARSR